MVDVVVGKTLAAARTGHRRIVLGGGVAANPDSGLVMSQYWDREGIRLFCPRPFFAPTMLP